MLSLATGTLFAHLPLASSAFDFTYVQKYFFNQDVVKGALLTIVLAVISQLSGTVIGLILYLLRRIKFPLFPAIANVYIWFFRGTPLLVQIFILFNLLPVLGFVHFLRVNDFFLNSGFTNTYLLIPFLAAYLSFSFNEGAYMSEIVRAGIDSIDTGQMEAAKSLGMGYGLSMRRIVLPQAFRVIMPPLGNEFNSMLKTTSLAYGIGMTDLFGAVNNIGSSTFHVLELFVVASIYYLAMTTLWGLVQQQIEYHFAASDRSPIQKGTWQKRLLNLDMGR